MVNNSQTPSAEAMKLAKALNTAVFEPALSYLRRMTEAEMAAKIDTALSNARLKGVKLGLEASKKRLEGIGGLGWSCGMMLDALDPQQVINEIK
jgi:hypothetical protein